MSPLTPDSRSPSKLGYRMPAEWEPHQGTWISWPHNRESWPGKFRPVSSVFVEIVSHLSPVELVNINVNDREMEERVRNQLRLAGVPITNVRFHLIPTNDAWVRDHGPTFVTNGEHVALVNWTYNAWGRKYKPFDLDDRVPMMIADQLSCPAFSPSVVLEGGSIDVNGRGTLLTTESCLLNSNRNPSLTRDEIEHVLEDFLGVSKVLWLGEGIAGDDTDGHIDDLARFVDASTVVTVIEDDPADENYRPLSENLERLRGMSDQNERPLNIVTLPMPGELYYQGHRLPASYANFYIANGLVIAPTYNSVNDRVALETLQKLFPDRRVVGIHCLDLVWGLGAVHCVTQQQPATGLHLP